MTQSSPEQWQLIENLFDRLIELPNPLQQEALAAIEDRDVSAQVSAMLAASQVKHEFLDQPLASDSLAEDAQIDFGSRIDAWQILESLGRGGMGTVYRAERADGKFRQQVALKIAHAHVLRRPEQFHNERQILATLEHPGIARLIDGGLSEDGRPYMVMELVEGQELLSYCRERNLDLQARLALFAQICEAVGYAHRHLVVHRDLKPSNILVTAEGQVKLLDFGVAKLLDPLKAGSEGEVTLVQMTPEYAAPEQMEGKSATTSTDVFSLGVLLYRLLTDLAPWSLRELPLPAALQRLLHSTPRLLSAAATANPNAPVSAALLRGDLDAIVAKAMRSEPDERYMSATALLADLQRHLRHEPVQARGGARSYLFRSFVRRHRVLVAAVTVVFLSLLAGILGTLWQARRAEAEASSAKAAEDFMLDVFTQAEPWRNHGKQPTALELAQSAMTRIDSLLSGQPLARSDMYFGLARLFTVAGDVRLSVVAARKSLEILQSMAAPDHDRLFLSRVRLIYTLIYVGDYAAADHEMSDQIAAGAANEREAADNDIVRALLARDEGRLIEFESFVRSALPYYVRTFGERSKSTGTLHYHLSSALAMQGRYAEAQSEVEQDYRIYAEQTPVDDPERYQALQCPLVLAAERDAPLAATEPMQRVVRQHRAFFGRSAYLADVLARFGRIENRAGHQNAAIEALEEACSIYTEPENGNALDRANCSWQLGGTYMDAGRQESAQPLLISALSTFIQVGGENDPRALAVHGLLAELDVLKHDPHVLSELRELAQRARSEKLAQLPEIGDSMGRAARDDGLLEEAELAWRQALNTLEAQGRPLSVVALKIHSELADLLAASQRQDEAQHEHEVALEQALALFGEPLPEPWRSLLPPPGDLRAALLETARENAARFPRPGLAMVETASKDLDLIDAAQAHIRNEIR